MPLLLAEATLEVGAAIAKSILKLWIKNTDLGNDISSGLIDLLKSKTSDIFAQRKGERQFAELGDKIGENLLPLFEVEGARLDEGGRTAVALAVAETFNKSKLSSAVLTQHNLEPTQLTRYMLAANPNATRDFSDTEASFYQRIIKESCTYIVDIASQLPTFTEQSFAEVLKREGQIINIAKEILEELRKMRDELDPTVEAERFEIEYRQAVARNLDILQLIGADVSLVNRRHKLSVAYITLSVEQGLPLSVGMIDALPEDPEDETGRDVLPVDIVLARSRRLLIRGLAGSGKTTLLQWIAVRAATKTFDEDLAHWNTKLPFYIRLRHCVQSGLPRPEDFPGLVAPLIADTMPKGWAHAILKSGRALVLVDGVDEIPVPQREDVQTWLNDLVETYKDACFIITSRPHAIQEGWLNHEAFGYAELQPMQLPDIYSFIDHWHNAVREELHTDEEKNELGSLADHLKEEVRRTRSIRNLATSPLLCAMLCALNRDRRQQLPANRIELYKACCSLLLERRDKESRVDLTDYPALNIGQKERLLQDLAYWMIQENLSEAEIADVDERFTRQLGHMPNFSQEATGADVRRLLVERAGIIREPVAGRIDFTHRTFEEFFAAQAALDMMDIEKLVANAHNDQWREIILLASGLASKPMCEQLIAGLIRRGDEVKASRYQYQLYLLAVSCLDTAIQLGPEIKAEAEKRLSQLVPPKNITDAKAIAGVGELAVKYLAKKWSMPATVCAACVRALTIIGGDAALDMLEGYTNDWRTAVVTELVKAWDAFDRETYARRILSKMFPNPSALAISHLSSVDGLQYFTDPMKLKRLELYNGHRLSDLRPLAGLTNLMMLRVYGGQWLSDLRPLAGLTNLRELDLSFCTRLSDLRPLAGLTNLAKLIFFNCSRLSDLRPLAGLTNLTNFQLSHHGQLSDLRPLAGLTNLTELKLTNGYLSDLTPLAGLTNLRELDLSYCGQLSDLRPLAGLTNLTTLKLQACSQLSDLTPLAGLTNLTTLDLSRCRQITDWSVLTNLNSLRVLTLSENPNGLPIPLSIKKKVRLSQW